jgi:hypothetical protein
MKVLTLLTETIVETIIEAVQKKAWTAFINNTFALSDVAFRNKALVRDFKAIEENPELLEQLKKDVLEHHKVKELEGDKAGRIFNVIWLAVIFNSKTILEVKGIIEE